MTEYLATLPGGLALLGWAISFYLLAGVVKGTLGIGFPTAAVSLLAQVADARTAITLVILPMLMTNLWQVWRSDFSWQRVYDYRILLVSMLVFIVLFSQLAVLVPIAALTMLLGLIVAVYALHSLYSKPLTLPSAFDQPAQWVAGISSGVMGGLVSVWAPPVLIYLRARRLEKEQFVATAGLVLLAGSVALFISYLFSGVLRENRWVLSAVLVVPAIAGFAIGEQIRRRLSAARFERLILWFFLLMGLNLIRRAI